MLRVWLSLQMVLVPCAALADERCVPVGGAVPAPGGAGGVIYLREPGARALVPAPSLATEVDIQVSGVLARAVVRQQFHNDTDVWQDGLYVFPLPDRAAVYRLYLRIGDRFIEGRIQERARARRTYELARREGKKTSLVEQQRPNVFTMELANIGPGERIEVVLEYQETLHYDQGVFELRFPLVVAPRFETDPGSLGPLPSYGAPGGGVWNPVYLQVDLAPGFPLAELESPSHAIELERPATERWRVILWDAPADRDFVLRFTPERGAEPVAALLSEEWNGHVYVLLVVLPPRELFDDLPARLARETVLVIDTSGSMGGASIRQARAALGLALERLAPDDFFNVIAFNSVTTQLFRRPRRASARNLGRAGGYVEQLEAQGGTVMQPALERALHDSGRPGVRQVVFVTDGAVGNERELFARLQQQLGRSRLFTVGIGSAPNSYFMRRAARFGRGTFTFIGRPEEVADRMNELFEKLEDPVLAGLDVRWPDGAEMWPERIPDLYAGEPLVVAARIPRASGEVWIWGQTADRSWEERLAVTPELHAGIHQLWARSKIASLLDRARTPELARDDVLDVALRHELLSRFTSLVAVDVTPTRPRHSEGVRSRLPLHLPHGWDPSRIPGVLPAGSTPAPLLVLLGAALLLLAVAATAWRRHTSALSRSP